MTTIAIEETLDQLGYQLCDVGNAINDALKIVQAIDPMPPEQFC